MTASTHRKIRKNGRNWVTKINKKGKQPLVAPVVVEDGPVLMASTTVGTQANSSDFIFYKGGQSKNTRMSFIIDTTKNPDNASDKTIIIPFTLYTPSYSFTIDWGDGNSTTYAANTVLTTVGLTHTYSTAGQYIIVITSDSQKIPVLNWSTSGNVGGNKHKLIQLSTPLITFDTACPNSNSAQYFAYECDNLLFISSQLFINNPQIRNYDYCFSKCSKLVKVPFDIFKYVKYQSTYQEVFAHDIALQSVPNDLFATAKGLDFSGAFNGDSNLVLDVDLDTFFGTEPYINVDVHDIFRDCVKTTGDAVEFTKKFTEYVAYVIGTGTFDTGWGTLTGKIYAQPIYNSDGKLVRDLVPAKTGNFYGGKVAPQDCLWDEVQQEFLLPTTTYTYGTEIDMRSAFVIEDGELIGVNENVYLQNTGTSYVNTGITADSDTSLVINYKIDSSREIASGTRNWICGGSALYNKLGNFYAGFWQTSATNIYYWLNTSNKGAGLNAGSAFTDFSAKYKIELNGANINTTTYLYKNNTTTWTYLNNTGEITQSSPITLFNRYASLSSTSNYFLGRVYNCSISKNGVLLQKLVPVPKGLVIGDFVVPSNGMFDIVTQTFYGNEGAGEFNIGTDTPLDTERENNLPYSFKKNALYNCEKWANFAIPESVWTGIPSSREDWLAVNEGKTNWLLTDSMNMLLLESANSNILCSPTDALKADTEALLSWYTGTIPEHIRGIIKPEPYESVDSLRNIIEGLPELRGYTVVGSPTISSGVASGLANRTNYLSLSQQLPSTINSFEMVVRCDLGSSGRGSFAYSYPSGYYAYAGFYARVVLKSVTSANAMWRYKAKQTSSETDHVLDVPTGTCISDRTTVLVYNKLSMETVGENDYLYSMYQSLDGQNWTLLASKHDTYRMNGNDIGFITLTNNPNDSSGNTNFYARTIDLNGTYIKVNGKLWFDGTEKLNEVLDLSGCVNKGGLTSAELQTVIDKGYTLVLN